MERTQPEATGGEQAVSVSGYGMGRVGLLSGWEGVASRRLGQEVLNVVLLLFISQF